MSIHPEFTLIERYGAGAGGLDDASVWAIEAHLEGCDGCRRILAGAIDDRTRALLDRVALGVAAGLDRGPAPAPRRRARRSGIAARVLPWLATATALMLAAVLFERTFEWLPSLVLLLAPVAPLLPVAAAWSRRTDPAWELIAATPRAGAGLLLRRTLAALAAVIPVLALAGWWTGHAPALWLLPCLAFTAGTLALGGPGRVDRAAVALAAGWAAAVVAPSLATARLPVVLSAGSWPGWAAAIAVLAAVVGVRALRNESNHGMGAR
ncbi:zf-HC2 domain-containing protein [Dactylosporangium sp. CA-233914]|uniref:zf-HC2 domain-containing protein n=1 Tax=Dactylosporangium sp. CA-233914 TaxID=3239934 RepID=UPI003D90AC86